MNNPFSYNNCNCKNSVNKCEQQIKPKCEKKNNCECYRCVQIYQGATGPTDTYKSVSEYF